MLKDDLLDWIALYGTDSQTLATSYEKGQESSTFSIYNDIHISSLYLALKIWRTTEEPLVSSLCWKPGEVESTVIEKNVVATAYRGT